MHHLLAGDAEEHPAPPLDDLELIVPKTGTRSASEAERGVEVLAHHGVLELSALGEQVGQLFPALHEDGRLSRHGRKVSPDAGAVRVACPGAARGTTVRECQGAQHRLVAVVGTGRQGERLARTVFTLLGPTDQRPQQLAAGGSTEEHPMDSRLPHGSWPTPITSEL